MGRIVGIDLGTTNSVVACMEGGEPMIVPNARGERLTPSMVAFTKNTEVLVGEAAKNQAVINHERTIASIKRRMGAEWEIELDEERYTPARISGLILAKLKADAEAFLEEEVDRAIITVPAYFNDNQRQATKLAGELAGLEVIRLINEPTAASLAYGLGERFEGAALVFDLGGGTFDVSILDVGDGVFEVIATAGNNQLGGDDFDFRLMEWIMTDFRNRHGIDLSQDRMAVQKIREAAEATKIELSESMIATINIPFISANDSGPLHIEMELTREQFESMIADYMEEVSGILDRALDDAGRTPDEIDRVILVGGSTRIPAVQGLIEQRFEGKAHKNINPDECVAIGAAVQSAIIDGKLTGLVLVDVTPLTLGIETENDIFVPIIPRNTTIPATASRLFTTISDYQRSVEVMVLQGERKQASKNISLGKFLLKGINPLKKGEARVQVTFDIDVNGIVHVSARDMDTNAAQEVEISVKDGPCEEEIDYLVKESERFEENDRKFVELQTMHREADQLVDRIRNEMGRIEELPAETSVEIEDVIIFLEESLESEDPERIKDAIVLVRSHLEELKSL